MSQQTSTSETIVALYLALKLRDSCEACNGSGVNWVGIGDETEVDAEPCQCSEIAWYVLEKYKSEFEFFAPAYLVKQDIPHTDENLQPDALMNELFKNVR